MTKADDIEKAAEQAAADEVIAEIPKLTKEAVAEAERVAKKLLELGEQEIDNYRRAHAETPHVMPPMVHPEPEPEKKAAK